MKHILFLIGLFLSLNVSAQFQGDIHIDGNQSKTKQYVGISENGKELFSTRNKPSSNKIVKGIYHGVLLTDFADAIGTYLQGKGVISGGGCDYITCDENGLNAEIPFVNLLGNTQLKLNADTVALRWYGDPDNGNIKNEILIDNEGVQINGDPQNSNTYVTGYGINLLSDNIQITPTANDQGQVYIGGNDTHLQVNEGSHFMEFVNHGEDNYMRLFDGGIELQSQLPINIHSGLVQLLLQDGNATLQGTGLSVMTPSNEGHLQINVDTTYIGHNYSGEGSEVKVSDRGIVLDDKFGNVSIQKLNYDDGSADQSIVMDTMSGKLFRKTISGGGSLGYNVTTGYVFFHGATDPTLKILSTTIDTSINAITFGKIIDGLYEMDSNGNSVFGSDESKLWISWSPNLTFHRSWDYTTTSLPSNVFFNCQDESGSQVAPASGMKCYFEIRVYP